MKVVRRLLSSCNSICQKSKAASRDVKMVGPDGLASVPHLLLLCFDIREGVVKGLFSLCAQLVVQLPLLSGSSLGQF